MGPLTGVPSTLANQENRVKYAPIKIVCQYGLFEWGYGHFLLISIDAQEWAHELLRRLSMHNQSTYQITEGDEPFVGYEFPSKAAMQIAIELLRKVEFDRFSTRALPQETVCSFSD
jgi:hypothetical protein